MNGLKPSSANFCLTFSASARELNGPTSTRNNLSPERTSPGVSRKAEYPRPFKTPTSVAASCLELEATTWTAKPPCRPALLSAAAALLSALAASAVPAARGPRAGAACPRPGGEEMTSSDSGSSALADDPVAADLAAGFALPIGGFTVGGISEGGVTRSVSAATVGARSL